MENLQYDFPVISENDNFSLFEKLKLESNELNFDQYTNKVYKDLSKLESDIISQLISHDKEFISIFKNFDDAEAILDKLETNLENFKDKLTDINQDMKILQTKSSDITIRLKNRKEFEEELFKLLDLIILAPDFLNDITNKEVDDDFIDKIKKLDEKLQIFRDGDLPDAEAIRQIRPEMSKTLAKVGSKIYTFVLNNFVMLSKQGTNIQMIQKHILLKSRPLVVFLSKHIPPMYTELVSRYITLMEKIYYNSSIKYCGELNRLIYDKHDKFSLISSEELNKDLFLLVNKRKNNMLNEIEKDSIVPLIAQKNKETFFYEQIFQSLNKFMMDLITWEVLFLNDFFDLGIQQSSNYLNSLFKNCLTTIYDNIQKNIISKCNDFFAISLMIIVNFEQKKIMENRKLNHLDLYFGKLDTILWPKFDGIFKTYIDTIFKVNVKNTKLLINGIHTVTYKLGEFLSMLNLICKHTTTTPMLLFRIKEIQKSFNQFFCEIAENYKFNTNQERDEMITLFFINNLYYLLTKLHDFEAITTNEDPTSFDKTFNNKMESYLNILMKKHFEELNRVLINCISKVDLMESIRDTTRDMNKSVFDPNEINFNKYELDKLTKSELKNSAVHFNAKYKDIFENVKKDIYENVKDKENAKLIYRRFLNEFVIK
jgi:vacuolar protein sorting-associated protein 52